MMIKKVYLSLTASLLMLLSGCSHFQAPEENLSVNGLTADQSETVGDRYLNTGEIDKALYHYLNAVRKNQDDLELYYKIAYVYYHRGDLDSADLAYNEVLTRSSGHAGALEGRGLIRLKKRDYGGAADFLTRAVQADATRLKAHNGLGIIADLGSKHTLAVAHYRAALEIQPESVRTITNLGFSHYLAGTWSQAEAYYQKALVLEPKNVRATQNLGLLYARQGKYNQAIKKLSRIMTLADAYNDVGYASMLDDKYPVAARFFNEAMRLSPSFNEVAHNNLMLNRKLATREVSVPGQQRSSGALTAATETIRRVQDGERDEILTLTSPQYAQSHSDYQSSSPLAQANTPQGKTDQSQLTYLKRFVAAPVLRVREGAGVQSAILDKVARGRVVRVLRQDNDWAFIKYWQLDDGNTLEKTGWVHSQYLVRDRHFKDG